MLNLIEIFASVQGETSYAGLPTTFIRLAACNLRCTWCDTTYSFGRGDPFSIDFIQQKTRNYGCKNVCVTGGEPLLQENVYRLLNNLCDEGYVVSLETGGSISTSHVDSRVITILDVKCPGSGMSEKNYWQNMKMLREHDEVKFVIKDENDYEYSKNICEEYGLFKRTKQVLFSPVHGLLDPKDLVHWILKDKIPARLNLQIHKYVWTPETKGV
jgi:7-carboxy-7-deazaguanine synthase